MKLANTLASMLLAAGLAACSTTHLIVDPHADAGLDAQIDGCTDDASLPPGAIALADLPAALAAVYCAHHCDPSDDYEQWTVDTLIARSPENCVEFMTPILKWDDLIINHRLEDVAACRTTYDGLAAADCIAQLAASCTTLLYSAAAPACQNMFVGTGVTGSPCAPDGRECSHGFHCTSSTADGECGRWSCQPGTFAPVGSACSDGTTTICSDSRYNEVACLGVDLGPASVCAGVVVRTSAAALGEPCGVTTTAHVYTANLCGTGLFCNKTLATPVCQTRIADGAACSASPNYACVLGDECTATTNGEMRCSPIVLAELNEACSDTVHCNPTAKLACVPSSPGASPSGTCKMITDGSEGTYCSRDSQYEEYIGVGCQAGFYCSSGATCTRQFADGAACANNWECVNGSCNSGHCGSFPPACGTAARPPRR